MIPCAYCTMHHIKLFTATVQYLERTQCAILDLGINKLTHVTLSSPAIYLKFDNTKKVTRGTALSFKSPNSSKSILVSS